MRRLISLVVSVCLGSASSVFADSAVLSGGVVDPSNGYTYYLLNQNTWANSEAQAQAMGGTLATVTDSAENSWISTTFGSDRNLWVGLWDPTMETSGPGPTHTNNFVWASGSSAAYRNWAAGEPNDLGSVEYYSLMWGYSADIAAAPSARARGAWDDSVSDPSASINQPYGVVEITSASHPIVPTLFNTGVDNNGNPLPDGTVGDPHYTLVSIAQAGQSSATRVRTSAGGSPIGPWVGDDANSAWIGPNNNSSLVSAPGNYDYHTTFTAPDGATSVTITGQWATGDSGTDILLDGVSSNDTAGGSGGDWNTFTLSGAVVGGAVNTLDFIVNNAGGSTGLRVEFETVTFVPEPASAGLLAAGLLVIARRRRRV